MIYRLIITICNLLFVMSTSWATRLPLPAPQHHKVDQLTFVTIKAGDSLHKIARQYDVGYFQLVAANPYLNPEKIKNGDVVVIPSTYLLPPVTLKGIIINLATMRLYYFPKNKNYFYTYPVGIGRYNWSSPVGKLHIIQKTKDPVWIVPDKIMQYRKEHGDPVDKIVQAGPDNPLGKFAMRLSNPIYMIHGTNDPDSVGVRSSAGCIHLYPEDIKELFSLVPLNTSVLIINQPYIIGWHNKRLLLEAHLPLKEQRDEQLKQNLDATTQLQDLVDTFNRTGQEMPLINKHIIDWALAAKILKEHTGISQAISK